MVKHTETIRLQIYGRYFHLKVSSINLLYFNIFIVCEDLEKIKTNQHLLVQRQ